MMTPLQILRDARVLLTRADGWTKTYLGSTEPHLETSDADGEDSFCAPNAPEARCWCLNGALSAVCNYKGYPADSSFPNLRKAYDYLAASLGSTRGSHDYLSCVYMFNDSDETTQADVLRQLDLAILLAEKDEEGA